jgi:hypothetical protein
MLNRFLMAGKLEPTLDSIGFHRRGAWLRLREALVRGHANQVLQLRDRPESSLKLAIGAEGESAGPFAEHHLKKFLATVVLALLGRKPIIVGIQIGVHDHDAAPLVGDGTDPGL